MVEVCKESRFNSIFKANILDFAGFGNKSRKKHFRLLQFEEDFGIMHSHASYPPQFTRLLSGGADLSVYEGLIWEIPAFYLLKCRPH